MVNTGKWKHYLGVLIGLLAIGAGAYLFMEGDTTMRMVEAGGIISQAVAESQYRNAANLYLYGGIIMIGGFAIIIANGFFYVGEVLKDMSS